MQLEVLAIGVAAKQLGGRLGYPGSHRHEVEGNDVGLAVSLVAILALEEVRQTQPTIPTLAWEHEPRPLAAGLLTLRAPLMVKHHKVVSFAVAREVAIHDCRLEKSVGLDPVKPHAQPRPALGLDQLVIRDAVLATSALEAPLPQEGRPFVKVWRVVGQSDALDSSAA